MKIEQSEYSNDIKTYIHLCDTCNRNKRCLVLKKTTSTLQTENTLKKIIIIECNRYKNRSEYKK